MTLKSFCDASFRSYLSQTIAANLAPLGNIKKLMLSARAKFTFLSLWYLSSICICTTILVSSHQTLAEDIQTSPPPPGVNEIQIPQDSSTTNAPFTEVEKSWNTLVKVKNSIKLGSYNEDASTYPSDAALCLFINHERPIFNLRCDFIDIGDFEDTLKKLKEARIDIMLMPSNIQKDVLTGSGTLPYKNLRFIASLYESALTILVRGDSSIYSLDDVIGKVINVGDSKGYTKFMMDDVFLAKNWQISQFKGVMHLPDENIGAALCGKQIDVAALLVSHPSKLIKDITRLCDIRILQPNDSQVLSVLSKANGYTPTIIPGGTYLDTPHDTQTIGVNMSLVTSEEESPSTTYLLTKLLLTRFNSFRDIHPAFYTLTLDNMFRKGQIAPFHIGVIRYLKEKNIDTTQQ